MVLKKRKIERDVWTLAKERVHEAYTRFDHITVSFSGGKDSTVALNVTIEVARELGRLPVNAYFWDEEAIHPPTIEYVHRVHANPDVKLRWLCVPHEHRNGCSTKAPYWYPWNPEEQSKWCREPPEFAERSLPGYGEWLPIPQNNQFLFPARGGSVGVITGIRAAESLRRYRSVAQRVHDNWIAVDAHCPWVWLLKPVYDWTTNDVWTAPKHFGWDYNRTYDQLSAVGVSLHEQRVCPPFGEEPMRGLWQYAQCWPELWSKMVARVPGAATAARYAASPLYAFGSSIALPNGVATFKDGIRQALLKWPDEQRSTIADRIQQEIIRHNASTNFALIPEHRQAVGMSWEFLYMLAVRGDLKDRKSYQIKGVDDAR